MALVNSSFTVNATPGAMPPVVHVSEYDVGRTYTVTINGENGSAFNIPSGTTATVEGTLNGVIGFTTNATISGSTVSFALTESMTAKSGKAWCKIKLTLNDEPIQTCAFVLAVDRAGVEADTVIGADGFEQQIVNAVNDWLDERPPATGGMTVISTNEAQEGKILQPSNRWVLFIRRDNLRSIEFTPLFSGTDDNSTFTWELYATTGGEDADYGSALTTIGSGTANCGDTLVFDKFTRKNAVGIRYVSPIQAFYCVPSAASDATVRVGVKQSGAIKAVDYGCFAGTVKMLLAERDPFITENVFKEKTITFYGDSLTEKNSRYTKGYRDWIVELCEMQSQANRGVGGYRLWEILRDMNANTDATDCISVMGGVNDGNAWDSEYLGELGDTVAQASDDDTSGTVYGTVYQLCDTLKRKYPTAFILLITPPAEKNPIDGKVSLAEIRRAMIETAELFAIPVYDNFKLSGINTRNKGVFTSDGLHWTDAAHEFIGKNIAKWLLSTFGGIPDLDSTAAGDGAAVGIRTKPHYATETWVEGKGYQTAQDVQTAIAAAAELPTGGSTGDFLRKTASGVAWETVQTWQGGSY